MRDLTNNNTNLEAPNPFSSPEDYASSSDYQASTEDVMDDRRNLLENQSQDRVGSANQYRVESSATNSVRSSRITSQFNNMRNQTPSPSNPFTSIEDTSSPFGGYPIIQFPLSIDEKEPDDYLHNPDPIEDALYDKHRFLNDLKNLDRRSLGGLIGFIVLFLAAIAVFVVVPALTFSGAATHYSPQVFEVLTQYQYPQLSAIRTSLIDPDTPDDAMTKKSRDGSVWDLVFSDEFNIEGRTFYDGDDQFFTAPDLHYQATQDLEWYDPDAVTTMNGTLNIRLDAYKNHGLFYRSGMVQTWNKLCFTQGMILVSASLPFYGNITGLWPGLWTLGNLGRPGYMSTTEGVWPYTYDSCDAGITPNQSSPDGISYLPGQKLNSCTCKGEDHPNPGVGRGAPEIDIIESAVDPLLRIGVASQSLQIAPYDIWYMPDYDFIEVYNSSITTMNTYAGGPFQQAVSGTTTMNNTWYEFNNSTRRGYQVFGYEYMNDNDDGYTTWYVGEEPTLTVYAKSLHPNGNIGWRRIPKEPMSLIMNLGMSNSWAYIEWDKLFFPLNFKIDYVRLYQPPDSISLTCDPEDFPTYDYIQQHINAYSNVNFTSWKMAGYKYPKNTLMNGCNK